MSYQPPGGIAAPDYGQRPPRKSRAGLFIVLMVLLLVAVLGTGVWVVGRVVADLKPAGTPPTPEFSFVPVNTPPPTRPVPTKPARPPSPKSTQQPVLTAAQVAARFLERVNADDPKGAAGFACPTTKAAIPAMIKTQLRPPTKLSVQGGPQSAGFTRVFTVQGTTFDRAAFGVIVLEESGAGRACVQAINIGPG